MDSEILKTDTPAPSQNDSIGHALKLAGQSFLHSAVQEPLDGLTQLVNHVADHEMLPDPQFVNAPEGTKFGSKGWFAQTIGSGFGAIVPFLLIEGATDAALAKSTTLAEKIPMVATMTQSLDSSAGLASAVRSAAPASKMALVGAVSGLVLTPSMDPNKGFWEQRATNAATSGITFGAMGLASRGIMSGAEAKFNVPVSSAAFQASLPGIGFRLGANAIGGSIGGLVNAETGSLLSGNGLASRDKVAQSVASFLVTGAALDGAHIVGDQVSQTLAERAAAKLEYKAPKLSEQDAAMLEQIQKAHFEYFRQESDPVTGLTKDRSTPESPASIAAVGFSLTAHPTAVNHGWIDRDEAADYSLKVLRTLSNAPQGPEAQGVAGDHGFFYHFLDPKTGLRSGTNELSTIDTALLMSGVLFSRDYFNADTPKETEIRTLADNLYRNVDWNWAMNSTGRLSMGWTPESGFISSDWQGYNEAPIMLLMAIGSPTHPIPSTAWDKYASTDKVTDMNGQKSIEFGPLFGHQYSQVWLNLKGIVDATTKKLGIDYFENSRRATVAQHEYAVQNPQHWKGYSTLDWGLTASDGPGDVTKSVDGQSREFHSYNARGFPNAPDDGTIAPTAAAGSLPFAPELVMPTLRHWIQNRPEIFGPLGFQDAFNPTFDATKPSGWVDKETLGIDQGPILLMAENYRNGFVWNVMKNNPYLKTGLDKAGFTPAPGPSLRTKLQALFSSDSATH